MIRIRIFIDRERIEQFLWGWPPEPAAIVAGTIIAGLIAMALVALTN